MRSDLRRALVIASIALCPRIATAQSAADGPVLGARHTLPEVAIKIWVPAGELRLIAWDRDSVVVRGRTTPSRNFFFGGDSAGMKFGTDRFGSTDGGAVAHLVAYLPRHCTVSVKSITTNVDVRGISGWFYTVSGSMHLTGAATS